MKVSEQLLLLSKGYTRKEIEALKEQEAKELKESSKEPEPEKKDKKDPEPEKKDKKDPEPEKKDKKDPEPEKKPETDYKKLYDELKAQIQKNEADLKELQKANRDSDISEQLQKAKEEQDKSLLDLVRSYM